MAKVRLSLDVSPELNQKLDQLAEDTHSSKSDILRKAITLMGVAVEAKQKHQKLGIVDDKNHLVQEIIGV